HRYRRRGDRVKRREFTTLLGGAVASPCTWPFAAFGQASDKRPRRIGYISASSPTAAAQNVVAFLEGMRAHGYVEGRDIEIDYRWGEGHVERLPTLAKELVRSKIDLILARTSKLNRLKHGPRMLIRSFRRCWWCW